MNYFNYFTEIEETFIRRRGKHLLLSPLDWALIESWKERGIPLRIVVRGIENVFDAIEENPNRSSNIGSLSYCKNEIENLYSDWQSSQVGKSAQENEIEASSTHSFTEQGELFEKSSVEKHLERVSSELDSAKRNLSSDELTGVLDLVSKKLQDYLATDVDSEELERRLDELEERIDDTLLKTTDTALLRNSKQEIEKKLAKNKTTMDSDSYQRAFNLMLIKELREEAGIPRLSLFYL